MSQHPYPEQVDLRLRRLAELSDLRSSKRVENLVDMSPQAITGRLEVQAALRDSCLQWADIGRFALAVSSDEREQDGV